MVRTQIQLTEEQARVVKAMAANRGVSMAEVIREAVDRLVVETERTDKMRSFMKLAGRYSSGLTDVSVNHDRYLEEDYLA
jgi:Ribbon-helix-helix protein, copG family